MKKKGKGYLKRAGKGMSLADIDPRGDIKIKKEEGKERAAEDLRYLEELAYLMYAENRRSLLIVLQGIDASGKNGTTKHLAHGVNPDGLQVHSFGAPTHHELDRDFLWRVHQVTPRRGNIAIFNRSHYEEVLIAKVRREILQFQNLPYEILEDPKLFEKRYRQINEFERMLAENGTVIVKVLLHISRDEQLERLRERLENRRKNWKFNDDDLNKRRHWDEYMVAFEQMVAATSTDWAPWYVIPADRKWYRNLMVSDLIVRTLESLPMEFPKLDSSERTLAEIIDS